MSTTPEPSSRAPDSGGRQSRNAGSAGAGCILEAPGHHQVRWGGDPGYELGTRLTSILAALHVVQARSHQLDHRGREALDLLIAEVQRTQLLLDSLLDQGQAQAEPR